MFDMGVRLRELRERHKWSQEELGRKINKSKSTVSLYESNVKIPPGDTLLNLAALFNVSLDYLVGIDKNEMVSVERLTEQQKMLIHTILLEFQDTSKNKDGLSMRQQDILSNLMKEFSRKNSR